MQCVYSRMMQYVNKASLMKSVFSNSMKSWVKNRSFFVGFVEKNDGRVGWDVFGFYS